MKIKQLFYILFFLKAIIPLLQAQEESYVKEITVQKYNDFLNQEAVDDCHHLYEIKNASIVRLGLPGNYRYQAGKQAEQWAKGGRLRAEGSEKDAASLPISFLSYNDALQYCAWRNKNDFLSFSLQPSAFRLSSRSDEIDPELKSNVLTFRMVSAAAIEASGAAEFADTSMLDELVAEVVGTAAVVAGGTMGRAEESRLHGASRSIEERTISNEMAMSPNARSEAEVRAITATETSSSKKNQNALTLEGFEKALNENSNDGRFFLDKKGGAGILFEGLENLGSAKTEMRIKAENEIIKKELKKLLCNNYDSNAIHQLFPAEKKQEALTPDALRELLSAAKNLPSPDSKALGEVHPDFQTCFEKARWVTEKLESKQSQISEEDEKWLTEGIEEQEFQLADLGAAQAKSAEIARVATARLEQCKKSEQYQPGEKEFKKLNNDLFSFREILEGDADQQELESLIVAANKAHEPFHQAQQEFYKKQKGLNEALPKRCENETAELAARAQQAWEGVLGKNKWYADIFQSVQTAWNGKLEMLRATYEHYQRHQENVFAELSLLQKSADAAWEGVFKTVDTAGRIGEKREKFNKKYQEGLQAKNAFEKTEQAAATCLEDPTLYFFQTEDQRMRALREMREGWAKEIETYEKEIKKNKGSSLEASSNKIEALRRSVQAVEGVEAAERVLTQATQIEWISDEETVPSWTSEHLQERFIAKKESARTTEKKAKEIDQTLQKKMTELQKKYGELHEILSNQNNKNAECSSFEEKITEIKKSWITMLQQEVATHGEAWNEAARAMQAARDAKVNWARNILRLAGRASGKALKGISEEETGNFSLGSATKKEGELLGKLWVGPRATPWIKEAKLASVAGSAEEMDDEEAAQDGWVSCDQLRRFRGLSYKPDYGIYQMNFERRDTSQQRWQQAVQKGESPTWGNGHLTITNPHHDDAEENAMSLRFATLEPSQMRESFYAEKEMELKREAQQLHQAAQAAALKLCEIENEASGLVDDKKKKKADLLWEKAAVMKQEESRKWEETFAAYEKGLKCAPEAKKNWWQEQLEEAKLTIQFHSSTEDYQLWEKMMPLLQKEERVHNDDLKKYRQALTLIPTREKELSAFWTKKINAIELKQKELLCDKLYTEASKETAYGWHLFAKSLEISSEGALKNLANEKVDRLQRALDLWDAVIQRCSQLLAQERTAPQKFISSWNNTIEFARKKKEQVALQLIVHTVYKVDQQRAHLIESLLAKPANDLQAANAIEVEQGKSMTAWNKVLEQWNQGAARIPVSQQSALKWWTQQRHGIEFRATKAIAEWRMGQTHCASLLNAQAFQKATRAPDSIASWQEAIDAHAAEKEARDRSLAGIKNFLEKNRNYPARVTSLEQDIAKMEVKQRLNALHQLLLSATKNSVQATHLIDSFSSPSQTPLPLTEREIIERSKEIWQQAIQKIQKAIGDENDAHSDFTKGAQELLAHAKHMYRNRILQGLYLTQKTSASSPQENQRHSQNTKEKK